MKRMNVPRMPKRSMMAVMTGKHGMMIRRAANRNAHIITHHGKVRIGRKGRTG